jgi:hypothetical protein
MTMKKCVNCWLCFVVLAFSAVSAGGANILYISSMDPTHQAGEDALKAFMEGLGHTVTYFDDDESQAATRAAAAAADLVFISESVSSSRVANEITSIAVPMVITESYVWDEMGLTAGAGAVVAFEDTTIQIVNPSHFLAAGLSGTVTVLNSLTGRDAARFANCKVGGGGVVIARATAAGQTYDMFMVYDKGVALAQAPGDGSPPFAADIRVCLGLDEQSYLAWNKNAYALLKAAIDYALGLNAQGQASHPVPADTATDVRPDVILQWTAGKYAAAHDVYFGVSLDDVNSAERDNPLGVLVGVGQDANTFDPAGLLEFGRTYYWRIDEVNAPPGSTTFKGGVWSFTVEPYAYPVTGITATASSVHNANMGPEKTIDGSGLDADLHDTVGNDMWLSNATGPKPDWIQYEFDRVYKLHQMWVWNSNQPVEGIVGLGARNVTIEYSTDGVAWTTLAGVPELVQAPGESGYAHNTTVDFGGVAARYVKLTIGDNWNGGRYPQVGLSEVRFYYVPVSAREPEPASGATDVSPDVVLSWRPGREAASHRVYLSADEQAVADGTAPVATPADAGYAPAGLELGATYYWKVVEVNGAADPATWESDVWSFSTTEYLAIDDFESYTNDSPERLFQTWIDGYGFSADEFFPTGHPGNGTGSAVGHDIWTTGGPHYGKTIAETTIVHGGTQSMPLYYDNSSLATSEAQRTWPTAQDWTSNAADTLILYLRGEPVGLLELSSNRILMNGTGTDIFGTTDEGRFVYQQLTGDGSIMARVDRLDNTDAWAKAAVMIRSSLDPIAAWAMVAWAQENGARFQARLTLGGSATSDTPVATDDQKAVRIPAWVKIERKGDQFNGYYATGETVTTWTPMVWNPQTIVMGSSVYIGLAVTSHAAGAVTQAEFSNVATTGNVTGQWQSVSLGVEQPAGNMPDTLYVTLEDSGGRKATAVNTDPFAVAAGAWTPWSIPLSAFSSDGVNTDSIKKMTIGVGDKAKPASRATGLIYIDDIACGRPAPAASQP